MFFEKTKDVYLLLPTEVVLYKSGFIILAT